VAEHAGYHEPLDKLTSGTMERHRAIVSLMEELEAIDWYDQRVDATGDDALRAILAHNRDEEREHAAMTLEWLRRHDPIWDEILRAYLFTDGPITEVEARAQPPAEAAPDGAAPDDLGLGALSRSAAR
jgi:ferritin-like protein